MIFNPSVFHVQTTAKAEIDDFESANCCLVDGLKNRRFLGGGEVENQRVFCDPWRNGSVHPTQGQALAHAVFRIMNEHEGAKRLERFSGKQGLIRPSLWSYF